MRNDRVPIRDASHFRRGAAVVDIESSLAAQSLIENPQDFVAVHGDHEPPTAWSPGFRRSKRFKPFEPPKGGTPNQPTFLENPHDFCAVHWDHEPGLARSAGFPACGFGRLSYLFRVVELVALRRIAPRPAAQRLPANRAARGSLSAAARGGVVAARQPLPLTICTNKKM